MCCLQQSAFRTFKDATPIRCDLNRNNLYFSLGCTRDAHLRTLVGPPPLSDNEPGNAKRDSVVFLWSDDANWELLTATSGQTSRFIFLAASKYEETINKSTLEFILRPTVSRPVRLGIGLPFEAHDQILSLSFL
jgi:hypothetical protein